MLFQAAQLAYLVVPETQVRQFEQIIQVFASGMRLAQTIVTAFIRKGTSRAIQPADTQALCRSLRLDSRGPLGCWESVRIGHTMKECMILRLQGQRSDRRWWRACWMRVCGEALTDWTTDRDGDPALLLNFSRRLSAPLETLMAYILKLM